MSEIIKEVKVKAPEKIKEIPKKETPKKGNVKSKINKIEETNEFIIPEETIGIPTKDLSDNFIKFLQKRKGLTIEDNFIKYVSMDQTGDSYSFTKYVFVPPFYSKNVIDIKDQILITQKISDEVNKITLKTRYNEVRGEKGMEGNLINKTMMERLDPIKESLTIQLEDLGEKIKNLENKNIIIEEKEKELVVTQQEVKKKEEDILKLEHITAMQVQIINEMKKIGESIKSDFDTTGASTREEQEKVNASLNIIEKKTDEKNDFIDKVKTWTALIGAIGTLTLGLVGALTPIILSLVNLSKKDKANSKDYLALVNSLKKLQKQNLSPQLKSILDNIYDLHD